jgi:hypothetical protein
MLSDFAEFTERLKNLEDKSKVSVQIEEMAVTVLDGEETIFVASKVNFVWAFFMLFGINIDEKEPPDLVVEQHMRLEAKHLGLSRDDDAGEES